MGLYDRDYYKEEGGGWRGVFRRMFVEGDSPLNWALPLFTFRGVRVKVHILFIVIVLAYVLIELITGTRMAALERAIGFGLLFGVVLLHEFGHVFACRGVGGEADEILLWPLGGLAYCRPPHEWRAAFITTAGGPAVNLALAIVTSAVLLLAGAPAGVVLFNPFEPWSITAAAWFQSSSTFMYYLKVFLIYFHEMNIFLFLFNVFLPMFPMDGGRLLQEILWGRVGYERSMIIATNIGLFAAVGVGILALLTNGGVLLGVALFAGLTCWQERQRITFLRAEGFGVAAADPRFSSSGPVAQHEARPRKPSKAEQRRRKRAAEQQQEIDRILAKISEHGIQSLSRAEKKALARASEERKKG